LVGLLQMRPNALLVEMGNRCGYDFLMLDGEHGCFSETDYAQSLRALASSGLIGVVRLPSHDTQALRVHVETGADAIVVPHVSTAKEATALAAAMDPNSSAALIAIIESPLGVSQVEAILAVPGIDGVLVGPNDLTAELGFEGDYDQPAYKQALRHIENAALASGKFLGTAPHGPYSLELLRARGHQLFILGTDHGLLQDAMSAQAGQAKARLEAVQLEFPRAVNNQP
jgi:2-keto-3-deoxy-L-rhamnonate aldolase RhmA